MNGYRWQEVQMYLASFLASLSLFSLGMAALGLSAVRAADRDPVTVTKSGNVAVIKNAHVKVTYDLSKGIYSATDERDGSVCISDAFTKINEWKSNTPGFSHVSSSGPVKDELGDGKKLVIRSSQAGKPSLILEIVVYRGSGSVVLGAGVDNVTGRQIQVKTISPLTGAQAFPGVTGKSDCMTLNGISGSGTTRVATGLRGSSPNNLLLTFTDAGKRRSLVLGGLTYHEFGKYVSIGKRMEQGRRNQLRARLQRNGRLAAYVDCGTETTKGEHELRVESLAARPGGKVKTTDSVKGASSLRLLTGKPYTFSVPEEIAPSCFATVTFHPKEIVLGASGLDPKKFYILGFSWWDYNNDGRVESVCVEAGDGTRTQLLDKQPLPAFEEKKTLPEEKALPVPEQAYASGTMKIIFVNEAAAPNAVVSEVWLWEGSTKIDAADVAGARANEDTDGKIDLSASDPVGKRVDAGTRYVPADRFYVDFTTADPFEALEKYALGVRAAHGVHLNIYDFPTVCAWYAGCDNQGNGPSLNSTSGLVEEMEHVRKTDFLKYAPVALRLVPDKYLGDSEQGWWNDEHWHKFGHYTKPHETTRQWGEAMAQRGGLPFIYVQTGMPSDDYARAFPGHMLFDDISRLDLKHSHHLPYVAFDYTDPDFQRHLRRVWSKLRKGGVRGVMFDYPETGWRFEGGFEDKYATAASAYRTIFALAREAAGPDFFIHERNLGYPNTPGGEPAPLLDMTVGLVDSQRVWTDAIHFQPEMVVKCGLRWYKNRVLYTYDVDGKSLFERETKYPYRYPTRSGKPIPKSQTRQQALLTMVYVAGGRLLLGDSFRRMTPDMIHNLSRVFPTHGTPRSARPIDAFTGADCPRVYDFEVSPHWHQLTFYNPTTEEAVVGVNLSGDRVQCALGLDPVDEYYVYDFWNDRLVGRFPGSGRLSRTLCAGEARMMSIHRVETNPQVLSTNRHIMQGYLDMVGIPKWDAARLSLRGTSKVVGGETYKVILATNGYRPVSSTAVSAESKMELLPGNDRLARLSIDMPENATVKWTVTFGNAEVPK